MKRLAQESSAGTQPEVSFEEVELGIQTDRIREELRIQRYRAG